MTEQKDWPVALMHQKETICLLKKSNTLQWGLWDDLNPYCLGGHWHRYEVVQWNSLASLYLAVARVDFGEAQFQAGFHTLNL